MNKAKVIRVDIFDMKKLIDVVETAAWATKGIFLLMCLVGVVGVFVFGVQYPSPWLFVMLGASLILLGTNITLWVVWRLIKAHYNQWVKREMAQRAVED